MSMVRSAMRALARLPLSGLSSIGLFAGLQRMQAGRVAVLCYHGVLDEPPRFGSHRYVRRDQFEAQMSYLKRNTQVMSLSECVRRFQEGSAIVPRAVAITFDDGLGHLFDTAVPILQKYDLTATFFVVTDCIDKSEPIWTDKVAHIMEHYPFSEFAFPFRGQRLSYRLETVAMRRKALAKTLEFGKMCERTTLQAFIADMESAASSAKATQRLYVDSGTKPFTWAQVAEMCRSGQEFGSHSRTHPIMARCSLENMHDEALHSKRAIEAATGKECSLFVYPNGERGDFNEISGEVLSQAGYAAAFTTRFGLASTRDDIMTLPRVGISRNDTLAAFTAKLSGLWWNGL